MTDKEILQSLKKNPRQTPLMLSESLKMAPSHVRNVLSVLQELKLVQTPARGVYEITLLGKELLRKIE